MVCGVMNMPKRGFAAFLSAVLLAECAGCADGVTREDTSEAISEESAAATSEDDAEALPLELPEWVTIHHEDQEAPTDELILGNCGGGGYYAYNGRRYWVDIECGTGAFIEENGSYYSTHDGTGEFTPEEQLLGIGKIMYYYNAEEYIYLGCSETEDDHPEYYVHNDGEYMLRIHAGDDQYDGYYIPPEMLGEGRTPVEISLLVASKT